MSRAEHIVATIFLRDSYREMRIHYVARLVAFAAAMLVLSLIGTAILVGKEVQYRYVLLERSGKVMDLTPLSSAKHTDEFVTRWAIDATTQAHTFDFKNYQRQFQEAKSKLTVFGWNAYEEALKISGNFDAIRHNRYVATAVATGPGVILKKGELAGRFAWRIQFPMKVTYQSSIKTATQDLKVTVVVVRQPEFVQTDGLGIRSIIAE